MHLALVDACLRGNVSHVYEIIGRPGVKCTESDVQGLFLYHRIVLRYGEAPASLREKLHACARALLRLGLPVDLADSLGLTALHYAAARGFPELVRLFLNFGANVRAVDLSGKPPLFSCTDARTLEELLPRHGNLDENFFGMTALAHAAQLKRLGVAEALIRHGADPNAPTIHGRVPLHFAAANGDYAFVHLLLLHGAVPDVADFMLNTPAHEAARAGCVKTSSILYFRSPELTRARNTNGCQPHHSAIAMDKHEWLMHFHRIDPHVRRSKNVLHSIEFVSEGCIRALFEAGEMRGKEAEMMEYAVKKQRETAGAVLVDCGVPPPLGKRFAEHAARRKLEELRAPNEAVEKARHTALAAARVAEEGRARAFEIVGYNAHSVVAWNHAMPRTKLLPLNSGHYASALALGKWQRLQEEALQAQRDYEEKQRRHGEELRGFEAWEKTIENAL